MSDPASLRTLLTRAAPFALALGIWFAPVPAGLTPQAWHLFAIFASAIFSVIGWFTCSAFSSMIRSVSASGSSTLMPPVWVCTNTLMPLPWMAAQTGSSSRR